MRVVPNVPVSLGAADAYVPDALQADIVNNTFLVRFRVLDGYEVKGAGQANSRFRPDTLELIRRDVHAAMCAELKLDPAEATIKV